MSTETNQEEKKVVSRRKFLASLGMAGVVAASGGLLRTAHASDLVGEDVSGKSSGDIEHMIEKALGANQIRIVTIAELRAIVKNPPVKTLFYVKDQGQEGVFRYDKADAETADNTGTVLVSASGARFKRVFEGALNIKWFGAKGDDVADDTQAIQKCMNAAKNGTVYIPEGLYKVTSPIRVPELTSVCGDGYASKLHGHACDCLSFDLSNGLSPIVVEKFAILGDEAADYTAIVVPGAQTLQRTTGITFSNIYIAYYGTGMSLRGLWHSRVYGCYMNEVWDGIKLIGQSVKNVIDSCQIIRGSGSIQKSGDSTAIYVDSAFDYAPGNTEHRPEDVNITKTLTFGFDIGVNWSRCLYGAIKECDLDYCGKYGIYYMQTEGGLTISNNWIALTESNALAGIRAENMSAPGTSAHCLIQHNTIGHYVGTNVQCKGISIGWNQNNTIIDGNHLTNMVTADIHVDYCRNVHVTRNTLTSAVESSIQVDSTQYPVYVNDNQTAGKIVYNPNTEQIMINNRFVKKSVPAGGVWSKGDAVYNTKPEPANGKVVMGWYRVTDGTGHVEGTDWIAFGN
ncbi:glycosyl hydrolase family 28-related protein [Paenibacillus sp. GCM10027626]|uniref:glycosyl hydrolase family 28-related protein n=1 Tax=Paenibacillus sp. GCM10027626 TaxID=3273411 RepID=UPI003645BC04